jgi:hypothetical protein
MGLAQGVYVSANAGYGLGAGTQILGMNQTSAGTTITYYSFEGVFGSYGEGFKFGASAGYMFNKNFGTELGLSYWLGKTFEWTANAGWNSQTSKYSCSGFLAVPSIVVSADMKTINPYARFGLVFGTMKVKEEGRYEENAHIREGTIEETGSLAFGYVGALGIVVPAGGTVDIFAEVALHSLTYSPSQSEVTKLTVDGVDQKASLPRTVYKYEESFDLSFPPGTTDTKLAVRRPLSSIGIVVGVRINL